MKEKDHYKWNSKIKIDLGKTNYIGVGWIHLARYRGQWGRL